MSKLIVEMEMPTRCGACKCRHVEFDIDRVAVFCAIKDNEYIEDADGRPSWCPILGVLPEDHGDLIDRNHLIERCQRQQKDDWNQSAAPYSWANAYEQFEADVLNQKAVIAAERSET